MSYLDLFFGLIITWGAYNGFSKGLIKELASIVGVIAGIFLAKNYYPYLDLKLKPIFESDANFISILSATVIFLTTIILLKIIAKYWDDFQFFLTKNLTQAPKVSNVKTSLNIRSVKKLPGIPFETMI